MTKAYRTLFLFILLCIAGFSNTFGQKALLWEITGNGLKKPSYLYGTMHVSNKVAFHLSDTFFIAIKSCDAVALESSPETWLDELIELNMLRKSAGSYGGKLYNNGFQYYSPRNKSLAHLLSKDHGMINQMLYRFRGGNSDFEENTYLDLFIFQTAKKLKKQIVSLEDANEAMKLVVEGSIPDDDNEKKRRQDYQLVREAQRGLEQAYRNQDIGLIDSLNKILIDEPKMFNNLIVKRNETFVENIDSVLKTKSMFSAVGAAHLPGEEGVIEMLREKGYTLRPIKQPMIIMGAKSKSKIESIKHSIDYSGFTTEDSLVSFDVPAKCVTAPVYDEIKEYICTEFANGAYFSLTRSQTYGTLLGESQQHILKRIDSLLFENIPGKILKIKPIKQDHVTGYQILNRTKRGEYQRYNIYVTPLELMIFKVGAPGNFAKTAQAERFFSSIKLHNLGSQKWSMLKMPQAGYEISMPEYRNINEKSHMSGKLSAGHRINAFDFKDSSFYTLNKTSFHDFKYIEEDTFELKIIAKRYAEQFKYELESSEFVEHQGYPAYKSVYKKDSTQYLFIKVIIQGPHYYLLSAQRNINTEPAAFFGSFKLVDYEYQMGFETTTDTLLKYSATNIDAHKSSFIDYMLGLYKKQSFLRSQKRQEDYASNVEFEDFYVESSSELISMRYKKYHKYYQFKDSTELWDLLTKYYERKGLYVKEKDQQNNQLDLFLTDTNSIRAIKVKYLLHNDVLYSLKMVTDTLTKPTLFAQNIFDSFTPIDTVNGNSIFDDKIQLFIDDFTSSDSLQNARAANSTRQLSFDLSNEKQCLTILNNINNIKDLELKNKVDLIRDISYVDFTSDSLTKLLSDIYIGAEDTASVQIAVLNALTSQENGKTYKNINKLIKQEIPLGIEDYSLNRFFYQLKDSLELTNQLFPEMLDLASFPEFKDHVYDLLAYLIDSSAIDKSVYLPYKHKIVYDAKIELKRRIARNIKYSDRSSYYRTQKNDKDNLTSLSTILMTFYDDPSVQKFYTKTLKSHDNQLKMQSALLLQKNKKPLNDTIWGYLSKNLETRIELHRGLEELEQLHLFDSTYLTQKHFCFAHLYSDTDTLVDSVQFVEKREVVYKGEKGFVYFYKIKEEDESYWKLNYCGIQPIDSNAVSNEFDLSYTSYSFKLRGKANELEDAIEEILESIEYKDRKRVSSTPYDFYGYNFDF